MADISICEEAIDGAIGAALITPDRRLVKATKFEAVISQQRQNQWRPTEIYREAHVK
jgi:hypothetical protein